LSLTPKAKAGKPNAIDTILKYDSLWVSTLIVIGGLLVLVTSFLWLSPLVGISILQGFLFLLAYYVLSIAWALLLRFRAAVLLAREYAKLIARAANGS